MRYAYFSIPSSAAFHDSNIPDDRAVGKKNMGQDQSLGDSLWLSCRGPSHSKTVTFQHNNRFIYMAVRITWKWSFQSVAAHKRPKLLWDIIGSLFWLRRKLLIWRAPPRQIKNHFSVPSVSLWWKTLFWKRVGREKIFIEQKLRHRVDISKGTYSVSRIRLVA